MSNVFLYEMLHSSVFISKLFVNDQISSDNQLIVHLQYGHTESLCTQQSLSVNLDLTNVILPMYT